MVDISLYSLMIVYLVVMCPIALTFLSGHLQSMLGHACHQRNQAIIKLFSKQAGFNKEWEKQAGINWLAQTYASCAQRKNMNSLIWCSMDNGAPHLISMCVVIL